MSKIKLIGNISVPYTEPKEKVDIANYFKKLGVDELIYTGEGSYDGYVEEIKYITKNIDLPLNVNITAKKFDDVKYTLYAGVSRVCCYDVDGASTSVELELINESSLRFGKEKIFINTSIKDGKLDIGDLKEFKLFGAGGYFITGYNEANIDELKKFISEIELPVGVYTDCLTNSKDIPGMLNATKELIAAGVDTLIINYTGYTSQEDDPTAEFVNGIKALLAKDLNKDVSALAFEEFKLNSDGLIPVIAQDYKTGDVLMMAYMNKEAYEKTLETGTMTYFSRSRQSLWVKGETSGHYQYVQELIIDCDKDTILAKVKQIGVACHTGSPNCFFTPLYKKEYDSVNPLKILEEDYNIIVDRKNNPREGSYTNYLFDSGVDKILKKVGEEATEIIIAAKNPNPEEIKYEMADFLYHAMVLMVEKGVTWDDVVRELANRR